MPYMKEHVDSGIIASLGVVLLLVYAYSRGIISVGYDVFVLSFSMRNFDVRPLDYISPLSKRRKLVFVIAMVLAVLTAPHLFSSMH